MQILESKLYQERYKPVELTIAIPTWNRAEALRSQLEKIALAIGIQAEVIVCDNGSKDTTWEVLEEEVWRNRLMIKCLRNRTNLGCDANYLRAFEAASGEWTWLIGDDCRLNFGCFRSDVMPRLSLAKTNLILLSNQNEPAATAGPVTKISVENFFNPSHDHLSDRILSLSRSICRTQPAVRYLGWAYKHGMGYLHSYAFIYGKLFADSGLETIFSKDLFLYDPYDTHRWNLYEANCGAWKTNLLIYKQHKKLVRARDRRLRSHPLYESACLRIQEGGPLGRSFLFVIRELPLNYRIKIILQYLRLALRRRSARSLPSESEPLPYHY
jgi:glycosyltransferase involved in cell wall biosynthesis